MTAQHPWPGPDSDPERRLTLRWLGHDVAVSLCGHTLSPLVGITWWNATTGAWAGSRVIDTVELDRLVTTIDGLHGDEVTGNHRPAIDLGALIDGVLDQRPG